MQRASAQADNTASSPTAAQFHCHGLSVRVSAAHRCLLLIGFWLMSAALSPAGAKPLIGLSLNVPSGGGVKQLIEAVQTEQAAHVGLIVVSAKWSELEPTPGVYRLKTITDAVHGLPPLGFRVAVTISTLDTNNRTLPTDLQHIPFDSPVMQARFDALLRQIAAHLTDAVCDVNLGNEADAYLAEHPNELEAYARFIERGRTRLRGLKPNLPVGVTTTFDGLHTHPQIFRRLNRQMDLAVLTYYPLTPRFRVRPVGEVAGDFATMAATAGSKPLAVTEAGYPAAARIGSSEAQQAAFIDAVFGAAQKHAAHMAFVNFFLLYDLSPALVKTLLRYYRLPDLNFQAYLSTLGLRRADGTPRPAWQRFETRVTEWYHEGP